MDILLTNHNYKKITYKKTSIVIVKMHFIWNQFKNKEILSVQNNLLQIIENEKIKWKHSVLPD